MVFKKLKNIENEEDRVKGLYDIIDESSRLKRSNASSVEFDTTVHYMNKYISSKDKILDIGAGAGIYSLYFAQLGHEVEALELSEKNVNIMRTRIDNSMKLNVSVGNAIDLSKYRSNYYDNVFVMGPLYHIEKFNDKLKVLSEAKRVCKKGGYLFLSFINNDAVLLTEQYYNSKFLTGDKYNHNDFKVINFPFVQHTLDEMKELIEESDLEIIEIFSQDGLTELLASNINEHSPEEFEAYMNLHLYFSNKKELLGFSNHNMFICKNK